MNKILKCVIVINASHHLNLLLSGGEFEIQKIYHDAT